MKWASIRRRRAAALAATVIAVAACAILQPGVAQASTLQPGTAQASTYPNTSFPAYTQPVTLTWWTFTANPESEIKAFNKVYPNIHIVDPLMGASTDEYTRLTTAIKGGSGGPDVAEVEYEYLPKFIATDGLLNIAQYVDQYKDLFPSWTWNQVSVGKAVYGVPQDVGPMTMTYQPAVLAKYGLAIPKTWAQFAAEVATCTVGADLTVIVPGPPVADLGSALGRFADLTASSPARIYKVSEASVRRALDAGKAAEDVAVLFLRQGDLSGIGQVGIEGRGLGHPWNEKNGHRQKKQKEKEKG